MRNVEYFGCYEGPKGMSIALEVECFVCVCVGGGGCRTLPRKLIRNKTTCSFCPKHG